MVLLQANPSVNNDYGLLFLNETNDQQTKQNSSNYSLNLDHSHVQ